MTKYSDAELISILPPYLKNDPDVQAASYAFRMGMAKVIQFSRLTSLYANIDELNEELLDLMALELGTQYYDENMDINTKRKLIKNTLAWYKKAGTPSAVAELIEIVFGEGKIVEWFDFAEPPYTPNTFDIITNATMTEEMIEYFLSIIKNVKNARSHIRNIQSKRRIDTIWYAGSGTVSVPHRCCLNHTEAEYSASNRQYGASGLVFFPKTVIFNHTMNSSMKHQRQQAAAGVIFYPKTTIS